MKYQTSLTLVRLQCEGMSDLNKCFNKPMNFNQFRSHHSISDYELNEHYIISNGQIKFKGKKQFSASLIRLSEILKK